MANKTTTTPLSHSFEARNPESSKLYALQKSFTARIRDPEHNPVPEGIPADRMQVYQELLYNNFEDILSNAFPVIHKIYSNEQWLQLVRDFMIHHRAHQPYFYKIPEEFLSFLQHERDNQADPPFLLELAHYEWLELALELSELTIPTEKVDSRGDLLAARPVISPLAWTFQYEYPVHTISVDNQPSSSPNEPTYLIIFRRRDNSVKFMEINAVTARMLELIKTHENWTGQEVLEAICKELPELDPKVIQQGGKQTLEHLRDIEILVGTV